MLLPPGIDRKAFIDALRAEGIQTSIHYPPTHRFTYYKSRYGNISLPRTEDISEREVTLPLYPKMGAERVDLVTDAVIHTFEAMKLSIKDKSQGISTPGLDRRRINASTRIRRQEF